MGLCSLVERRNGIYLIRKNVPKDLQEALGKKTIKWSLRTADPKEAKLRKPMVEAEIQELFLNTRKSLIAPQSSSVIPFQEVSSSMQADNEKHVWNLLKTIGYHFPPRKISKGTLERVLKDIGENPKFHPVQRNALSEALRYLIHAEETGSYDKAKALALVDKGLHSQNATTASNDAISVTNATQKGQGKTIHDMFLAWKAFKLRTAKNHSKTEISTDRYGKKIERFIECQGNIEIGEINPDHLIAFRDTLSDTTEYVGKTINTYLTAVEAIVSFAANERYILVNPLKGVKYRMREDDSTPRLPWDKNDLIALFLNEEFRSQKRENPARFWIPLIGLFTGARVEEISQLRMQDIKEYDDLLYIDINPYGEEQSTKTKSSIRKVPLHPKLYELGFKNYLKRQSNRPGEFVFHDLKPIEARRGFDISKWFSAYKRKKGYDGQKVFHSFRHTLIDACRAAEIPIDMHEQIAGHGSDNIHKRYGYGHHVANLYPQVCKINYGIDFDYLNS